MMYKLILVLASVFGQDSCDEACCSNNAGEVCDDGQVKTFLKLSKQAQIDEWTDSKR